MKTRKSFYAAITLAFLAGCGDPENDRFSMGDKVIAYEHVSADGGIRNDCVFVDDTGDALHTSVPFGTHLSVVNDDKGKDESRTWSSRKVLIHIEDGEHKGKTGKVTRWSLRKSP